MLRLGYSLWLQKVPVQVAAEVLPYAFELPF
jgi:hypothetical protein